MKPKVVTFDCANTLLRVRWTPGGFALDCAREIGLELGPEARSAYEVALRSRWAEYQEINLLRNASAADAFWHDLTRNWLVEIGRPPELADALIAVAPRLLYGEGSSQFEVFDDVLPALDLLEREGVRIGVVSNWDYTLRRILEAKGLLSRFEHAIASLEEGVEKPDARLFHLALERFEVAPRDSLHVGDDPLDDFQGATNAGMAALLIDRDRSNPQTPYLSSLTQIVRMWE